MRRLRYAARWLTSEVTYQAMLLGYRLRPYDAHLDRRRWRWQRSGCLRSRIAWQQHPELATALDKLVEQKGEVDRG